MKNIHKLFAAAAVAITVAATSVATFVGFNSQADKIQAPKPQPVHVVARTNHQTLSSTSQSLGHKNYQIMKVADTASGCKNVSNKDIIDFINQIPGNTRGDVYPVGNKVITLTPQPYNYGDTIYTSIKLTPDGKIQLQARDIGTPKGLEQIKHFLEAHGGSRFNIENVPGSSDGTMTPRSTYSITLSQDQFRKLLPFVDPVNTSPPYSHKMQLLSPPKC